MKHSLGDPTNFLIYLLLTTALSWPLKEYIFTHEDPFRILTSIIVALLLSFLPFILIDLFSSFRQPKPPNYKNL